jgi:hypothetical protein
LLETPEPDSSFISRTGFGIAAIPPQIILTRRREGEGCGAYQEYG